MASTMSRDHWQISCFTRRRLGVLLGFLGTCCLQPAAGVIPSRIDTEARCQCEDPMGREGSDICYEPACPPGYYRCCASCSNAPCYGAMEDIEYSWRGVRECIVCKPGDYCPGCDQFITCPESKKISREGPTTSVAGTILETNCETCAVGMEANLDRTGCTQRYSHECNIKFVQRCIRGCQPENLTRTELTPCERMKCTMYCAKSWSEECAEALAYRCRILSEIGGLAPAAPGAFSAIQDGETYLLNCDVDCNHGSLAHGRPALALLWLLLMVPSTTGALALTVRGLT